MKNTRLQIHKNGTKEIRVPRVSLQLRDEVNRCATAERKSQRDWCIDALQDAINSSALRVGMSRIEQRLSQGVPSRPDEMRESNTGEPS